jgi:hypothetical protein
MPGGTGRLILDESDWVAVADGAMSPSDIAQAGALLQALQLLASVIFDWALSCPSNAIPSGP